MRIGFVPDLRGADLRSVNLSRTKLDRVVFVNAIWLDKSKHAIIR